MTYKTIFLLLLVPAGCATTPSPPVTAPAPAPVTAEPNDPKLWRGDPRLYNILNVAPLGQAQQDSLVLYARENIATIDGNLGRAARDANAPMYVRLNALSVLGTRQARTQLEVFREAIDDDDVRIRATAVASLRDFMKAFPVETIPLARQALRDDHPEVQVQSLQVLADREPAILRAYLPHAANEELRKIARDLIMLAEDRGAGAVPDSAGGLRRATPSGHTIVFTPILNWPQWQAGFGNVRIEHAGSAPVALAGIEVVAGVVPVFVATDGAHVVFERDRTIFVRNMTTGAERMVAKGVAPRLLPFSNAFVFMSEVPGSVTQIRERTRIRYEVMRAEFASDAAPTLLGATGVMAQYDLHGNYSPVRWMRVEEHAGNFVLIGDGLEMFALPNPFG